MSVSVCCPGCQVTCNVPRELLGRTGRCNTCARRIRLATPVAELLDAPEPAELPPLGDLMPIEDLPPLDAPAPAAQKPQPILQPIIEDDWPDEPVVLDEPAKRRPERAPVPPRRGPSAVLLALLALLGLGGGGVGGALLVRHFNAEPDKPDTQTARAPAPVPAPAPNTDPPAPPAPKPPEPKPPEPKPPEPKPPEPKPPEPKPPLPKPPEPKPIPKPMLKLPAPVVAVSAGGAGRYVAFQLADGAIVLFDAKVGKTFWTINGAKPDDLVALSRSKMFVGRVKEARVDRFDLATGAAEGSATLKGAAGEPVLRHLAVASAADGPMLLITQSAEANFRMRLVDGVSLNEITIPVDDDRPGAPRGFPFTANSTPVRVWMGADGRALTMGTSAFSRTDDRYRGAVLSGAGTIFPVPDGQGFVGSLLFGPDGARAPVPPRVPGTGHRYLPAATGPFMISAEYKTADRGAMKLFLHLGTDPNPIGPLPGGEEVGAWAKGEVTWTTKLHQRLTFLPEPGLVIFAPPNSESVYVFPVDVPALLKAAGHGPVFASVAPAEAQVGRAYGYRASAVGRGPFTFALEAGPASMRMTREGLLTWPAADVAQPARDVKISARDADGRQVVQTFRLIVSKEPQVVVGPKKEPNPLELKNPEVVPPPQPGAGRAVRLMSPATEVASGGNGRFLVVNLPATRQVAVFDAKAGKIVKFLPLADATIAAGRDHLFVVNNDAKTIERWSLDTFEKEATDKLPEGGPFSHAYMGSNSSGPLALCAKGARFEATKFVLLDTTTMKPLVLEGGPAGAEQPKALPSSVRVSPDGQTITWAPGRAARGAIVATVADGKAQWKAHPTVGNPLTPTAGGRSFYAYDGVYDDQLRRVHPNPDGPARIGVFAPAAQGNLFLEAEPGPPIPNGLIGLQRANVFIEGLPKPLATISGLDKPAEATPRLLHFAPKYGMLVALSRTGDELVVHPFDLEAALAKAPADYLVVLPDAPARPAAGARFEYALTVKSKRGGVKVKLVTGPDGLKVTDDGHLTWEVPAEVAGKEFAVALTVIDDSGQEVRQAFRLKVAAKGAAPPAPPAPPPRER